MCNAGRANVFAGSDGWVGGYSEASLKRCLSIQTTEYKRKESQPAKPAALNAEYGTEYAQVMLRGKGKS